MTMTPAELDAIPESILLPTTTLAECPIGLFWRRDSGLCLKSEYGNNEGRIDAYIVASGEMFWGLPPQTIASQRATLVRPVDTDRLLSLLTPTAADRERIARTIYDAAPWPNSGTEAVHWENAPEPVRQTTYKRADALLASVPGFQTVNAQLLSALKEMLAEKEDYMRRNKLGDPDREHTNKMAKAAIAAAGRLIDSGKCAKCGGDPISGISDCSRADCPQFAHIPMAATEHLCGLCHQPMPPGEEMFVYHGHSGPCPTAAESASSPIAQAVAVSPRKQFARDMAEKSELSCPECGRSWTWIGRDGECGGVGDAVRTRCPLPKSGQLLPPAPSTEETGGAG